MRARVSRCHDALDLPTGVPVPGGDRTARYPTKGERISLGSGVQKIYLGRAHAGARAAKSRIYFAAIYDRALTEPEIALRVAELRADD